MSDLPNKPHDVAKELENEARVADIGAHAFLGAGFVAAVLAVVFDIPALLGKLLHPKAHGISTDGTTSVIQIHGREVKLSLDDLGDDLQAIKVEGLLPWHGPSGLDLTLRTQFQLLPYFGTGSIYFRPIHPRMTEFTPQFIRDVAIMLRPKLRYGYRHLLAPLPETPTAS